LALNEAVVGHRLKGGRRRLVVCLLREVDDAVITEKIYRSLIHEAIEDLPVDVFALLPRRLGNVHPFPILVLAEGAKIWILSDLASISVQHFAETAKILTGDGVHRSALA